MTFTFEESQRDAMNGRKSRPNTALALVCVRREGGGGRERGGTLVHPRLLGRYKDHTKLACGRRVGGFPDACIKYEESCLCARARFCIPWFVLFLLPLFCRVATLSSFHRPVLYVHEVRATSLPIGALGEREEGRENREISYLFPCVVFCRFRLCWKKRWGQSTRAVKLAFSCPSAILAVG